MVVNETERSSGRRAVSQAGCAIASCPQRTRTANSQGKDNQAATDALREIEGIELAPVELVRRKAFPNAAAAGLSVLEYDDPKAREELRRLTDFLFVYTSDIKEVAHGNRESVIFSKALCQMVPTTRMKLPCCCTSGGKVVAKQRTTFSRLSSPTCGSSLII